MSNKDRVCIVVFYRDEISLAELARDDVHGFARYRRYHWAILIRPKAKKRIQDSTTIDVTNGIRPPPEGFGDLNPNRDWWFRQKRPVNPLDSGRFLQGIIVGKLPKGVTADDVVKLLQQLPLPKKGKVPEEDCTWWIRHAILKLQDAGYTVSTGVETMMDRALAAGDRELRKGATSGGFATRGEFEDMT